MKAFFAFKKRLFNEPAIMNQSFYRSLLLVAVMLMSGFFTATPLLAQKKKDAKAAASPTDAGKVNQLLFEGLAKQLRGDQESAIDAFKQCLQVNPRNDAALYALAKIYYNDQKREQALQYIEQAHQVDPNNKWYLELYGEIMAQNMQFKEAAAIYEKLVNLDAGNFEYYYDLAYMYIRTDRFQEAINAYDQLEKYVGVMEEITVQKQKLYMKLGKLDKAAAELQKLIDNDPQDGHYYQLLSELYAANNQPEKALEVQKKMLAADPNNPFGHLALGRIVSQTRQTSRIHGGVEKSICQQRPASQNQSRVAFGYDEQKGGCRIGRID